MKFKRIKASEEFNPEVCSASRCKQKPTVIFAAGVKHEKEVHLCDVHQAKLDQEESAAARKGTTVAKPKAEPALALVPKGTQEALAAEATDAEEALAMIQEFEIATQEDYDFANEALGDAKAKWKELEVQKKSVVQPLNAVLKTIRGWFKPPQDFYAESERILKAKLLEAHRKAAEAQDAALAAAQQAHATGDPQAVREALTQASTAEIQQAENVSVVISWDFEITDPAALPREYLVPDVGKIQGVVRAMKGDTNIPGVRVFTKETAVRRGA